MSKLKMLKFEAAALQNRSKGLIEQLQKIGVVNIEECNDSRLFESETSSAVSGYEKSIDVITDAFGILAEKGVKTSNGLFSGRTEMKSTEFRHKSTEISKYLSTAYDICSLSKQSVDLKAEISRLTTTLDSLKIWEKLDIPMTKSATATTSVHIGTLPKGYTLDELSVLLAEKLPDIREYALEVVFSSKEICAVVLVCHKSCDREVFGAVRNIGFVACNDVADGYVKDKISGLSKKIDDLQKQVEDSNERIKKYSECVDDLKFAFDYFTVKRDEYLELSNVRFSEKTIYLQGYVPEEAADKLRKVIEKNDGAVAFSVPDEDDDVPVIMKNGPFSEPVEGIVEMYATPGKKDIDPSKLMAFFYYLLFGMMLSDAGYGLVLGLGSALILKFTSVEGSMRKTLKMFVYCGISTVFWGALFGSWFGDAVPVICREFLGISNPPDIALWFDPLTDPITLLLFSFVIGICHLFLGLCAAGYMKWKDGDKVGALCDTVPTILTVLGAAPLAAGVLVPMPKSVTGIASYVAIIGVVLVVLTTSRSGNIFVRLGGGLYGLYNMASGYISDILSYSRLLALGLATGCIGSVVNMLAVMVDGPVIKVVVFVLVFILGHSLNMAINVLGAYVHTNRLQFVELFSKFYEGGGKAFKPFKFNTKYYKLKEDNSNE